MTLTDELKTATWHTDTVLEGLYAAKRSLQGKKNFDFSNWTQCTCGHIYMAATKKGEQAVISMEDPVGSIAFDPTSKRYMAVLQAVIEANNLVPPLQSNNATTRKVYAVSRGTTAVVERGSANNAKEAAIVLIVRTIAFVEKQHEDARLDVLAQTASVLEDAATRCAYVV